jgi:dolichyl-phosphate beta-glucosyltransferase
MRSRNERIVHKLNVKSLSDFDRSVNSPVARYTPKPLQLPVLSIVVPAFNEETRIGSCLKTLREALPRLVPSWEIVVADDGSADRTREVVEAVAAEDGRVRLLALPHRGKGWAVRRGLLEATGDYRFIADADLAMPIDNLTRFLERREQTGAAIIIGSREATGSRRVDEPWLRHAIGRLFNWLVRLTVVPGISDTQCGFKLLTAKAAEAICPALTVDGFAFDVEMLALARRAGFDVEEVGITWHGDQESRVGFGRGAAAFGDVFRIAWRLGVSRLDAEEPLPMERRAGLTVRSWAYILTGIFAAALVYDLMRMPVQVFDALEELLAAQRSPSVWTSFVSAASNAAYLRPLRIAQIKALFDLANGHYWLTFRGFHAVLMVLCLVLFTRALRVRTVRDLVAAGLALLVLTGLHTFRTTVQEAFPINHFLEIVVFALITLNLAQARPRLLVDIAAAVTFAVAALTLESGLLVWVVAVACWAIGLRGVSTRGIAAMTVLLGAYFFARFVTLSVGVPALEERSSGFLFGVLEPAELQARFGDRLLLFYAYNVAVSVMSVLCSEPQAGIFVTTHAWLTGDVPARDTLAVSTSIITTILIGITAVRMFRDYRLSTASDRLIIVFALLLAGNALLSFAYVKDDIMSVSGAFYALAAYAALRHVGTRAPSGALRAGLVAALLLILGTGWSVRSLGIHHVARTYAFKTRNDWASQPGAWKRSGRWPSDPKSQQLIEHLRNDALSMRVPNPRFEPLWMERVWGD